MKDRRSVEVWADWRTLGGPVRTGVLFAAPGRGKEVISFEYDEDWLEREDALALDPGLRLYPGPQFSPSDRSNFGSFLDSSPDRWGRVLLDRREALRAREEQRRIRPLLELDYLLGVFDGHRLGGLRFRANETSPFLDDDAAFASPPWTSLRELEDASIALEQEGAESHPSYRKWLMALLAPGRSLGGARPKASVVDPEGSLWIAKFPSQRDTHDIGAWEFVVHRLAGRAGVTTADAAARRYGSASAHHTFLTRRFDRRSKERVHFTSAMTLLQRKDGEDGASYLHLAEAIARGGANPGRDLEQLWRRIVFFMCVSNVDDHLRNHGFLLEPHGWALAPAYDMNPVAMGDGLTLNVSETSNEQDLELARSVARYFRISAARSTILVGEVERAVRSWREEAAAIGLSPPARDQMARAFRLVEVERAR